MRLRVPFIMLACATLSAGCGSSATLRSSRVVTQTRTVTRTAAAPASATTAPPTTTAATTIASSGPGECVASGLEVSFLGGQGATGHGELGIALKNTASSACATGGYPGVLFLGEAGHGLPTHPTHTTDDFFGHTALGRLTLAPGATASFRLGVSHVGRGGSDAGCTTAAGLQVIAPNDTATMRLSFPDGGIAECGGAVTVSPLQPGTSALK